MRVHPAILYQVWQGRLIAYGVDIMAVVSAQKKHTGDWLGPRNFHPPKRADLKYWWREAKKGLSTLPDWEERMYTLAEITEDTIILDLGHMVVYIARKKHLPNG